MDGWDEVPAAWIGAHCTWGVTGGAREECYRSVTASSDPPLPRPYPAPTVDHAPFVCHQARIPPHRTAQVALKSGEWHQGPRVLATREDAPESSDWGLWLVLNVGGIYGWGRYWPGPGRGEAVTRADATTYRPTYADKLDEARGLGRANNVLRW